MYKIGEFSKIVDTPVKTLRYYDEIGILTPVKTDEYTGYRFYDNNSVVEFELIKILKFVNFTLEEIKLYKNALTEEILLKKQKEIIKNIMLLNQKYNQLSTMINKLNKNSSNEIVTNHLTETKNSRKVLRKNYERTNTRTNL